MKPAFRMLHSFLGADHVAVAMKLNPQSGFLMLCFFLLY